MNRTIENQKFADIDIFVSYFDKLSLGRFPCANKVKVECLLDNENQAGE